MHSVLLIFHVLIAMALIGLILVQHGKGADMGAAFGSGASSTVFGARGSGSFLTTATAILAFLFFTNSFLLDYVTGSSGAAQSVMQRTAGGNAGTAGNDKDKDSTEIVDTKIEPIDVPAIGEEKDKDGKAAPAPGDLPPIPGAASTPSTETAQKLAPTTEAAPAPTAAVATSAPQPTETPEATPTPEPTVAPTAVPTTPPAKAAPGKKGSGHPEKHAPAKKSPKSHAKPKHD